MEDMSDVLTESKDLQRVGYVEQSSCHEKQPQWRYEHLHQGRIWFVYIIFPSIFSCFVS